MLGKFFYKMRHMTVSVAVAWTRFTVRWRHVLPKVNQVGNFVKTNLLNEWKG